MQKANFPRMDNFPGCCTSSVLYGLGEHGEQSEVTVDRIKELIVNEAIEVRDLGGTVRKGGKKCVFATSVDPKHIATLKEVGFKVVDTYEGIQGLVHILTLHD